MHLPWYVGSLRKAPYTSISTAPWGSDISKTEEFVVVALISRNTAYRRRGPLQERYHAAMQQPVPATQQPSRRLLAIRIPFQAHRRPPERSICHTQSISIIKALGLLDAGFCPEFREACLQEPSAWAILPRDRPSTDDVEMLNSLVRRTGGQRRDSRREYLIKSA